MSHTTVFDLPIRPPYLAMEALASEQIPTGAAWRYEPKWDGFRAIAFRSGKSVDIQSRHGRPLARYFPELVDALSQLPATRFVLDGEITITRNGKSSFDDLLQRIHPAASRITKLAKETPATYILFDLLVDASGHSRAGQPFLERRQALEEFMKKAGQTPRLRLSPQTADLKEAKRWYKKMRGDLDGLIAKNGDAAYEPGERTGVMQKIKNLRTADCVVGGFRYAERKQAGRRVVGSLLLGLYNADGKLDHVGFTSSMAQADRPALTRQLEKMIEPPGFTGAAPGGPSRWSTRRTEEWKPVRPRLVVEVQYDHFSGNRFRHGTAFLRWRPDKPPYQCRISQVLRETRSPITLLG